MDILHVKPPRNENNNGDSETLPPAETGCLEQSSVRKRDLWTGYTSSLVALLP